MKPLNGKKKMKYLITTPLYAPLAAWVLDSYIANTPKVYSLRTELLRQENRAHCVYKGPATECGVE